MQIQDSSFFIHGWNDMKFQPWYWGYNFCLFWCETHILYGQNKALLLPSDNKNLCDFDRAMLDVFRLYIGTQIKQTIPFARIMISQLPCHFNVQKYTSYLGRIMSLHNLTFSFRYLLKHQTSFSWFSFYNAVAYWK